MSNTPDTEPMNEREPRLTTADLADAATARDRAVEPRSFEDERAEDQAARDGAASAEPLFPQSEVGDLRARWTNIQTSFVDEPRDAVEQADGLVAEAIRRLAVMFANERSTLEAQWDRGDDVSTEDLRQALQRYRSFFSRLLSV